MAGVAVFQERIGVALGSIAAGRRQRRLESFAVDRFVALEVEAIGTILERLGLTKADPPPSRAASTLSAPEPSSTATARSRSSESAGMTTTIV